MLAAAIFANFLTAWSVCVLIFVPARVEARGHGAETGFRAGEKNAATSKPGELAASGGVGVRKAAWEQRRGRS